MRRVSAMTIAVVVLLSAGLAATQTESVPDENLETAKLAEERIGLLQQRIEYVEVLIKLDITASTALIEPTLDLINAKLDYAQSNEERRSLYDEMLKQYDRLIELAELDETNALGATEQEARIATRDDMLYLKSERLRIRIERESLR